MAPSTPHLRTLHAGGLSSSALELGEGPTLFCLHGFPDNHHTFHPQLPALAGAGFRVVAPLLRGYEPSSQPANGDYSLVSLAEDLLEWMDELGVRKTHVVGHDWGGLVGYVAAALAPARFHSVISLAVPHPRHAFAVLREHPHQLRNSWYTLFFQLPHVAEASLRLGDFRLLERLWRDWSPGWHCPPEHLQAVKSTFRQPGVVRAALEYYRAFVRPWSPSGRRTQELLATRLQVPTLALTGENDGCIDTRLFEQQMRVEDFPAGLRVVRVSDCGHFLHRERPELVNSLLLDWLT